MPRNQFTGYIVNEILVGFEKSGSIFLVMNDKTQKL